METNQTFDNIYQISNRNTSFKDGLNISSNDCDLTQTKLTNKTKVNTHDVNSVKNTKAKGKKRNTVYATNIKRTQLNLKIEDEQQYSLCNFCCKKMENKINEICENK